MKQKKAKGLAAALVSCTTFCLLGSMGVEGREGLWRAEDAWESPSENNPGNMAEETWESPSGNNPGNMAEETWESPSGNNSVDNWENLPGEGGDGHNFMTVSSGDRAAELLRNGTKEVSRRGITEDLICPSSYAVALNPYRMPVKVREGLVSTEQVISRAYGFVNKGDGDMTVTVTVFIEDLNGGRITFVDSAEEAQSAQDGVYAVYLALIPGDGRDLRVCGEVVGKDVSPEELSDVEMTGAYSKALALQEGENQIVFTLSDFSSQSGGMAAFTFGGAVNENAGWEDLKEGIRINISYSCEAVGGAEMDAESAEIDMID